MRRQRHKRTRNRWLANMAAPIPRHLAIVHLGESASLEAALRRGSEKGRGTRVYLIHIAQLAACNYGASIEQLHRLSPLIAASFRLARRWPFPIGLLSIEGGGTVEEVKTHFQEWAQYVPSGGIVLFHHDDQQSKRSIEAVTSKMIRPGLWRNIRVRNGYFAATRRHGLPDEGARRGHLFRYSSPPGQR